MNSLTKTILWPVAIAQGLWLKRQIVRLPEAGGPTSGQAGSGESVQVTIYGESPVAGVGVDSHELGIGPSVARPLADAWNCSVRWRVAGRNGLKSHELADLIQHDLNRNAPPDFAIICMGVNDSKGLTTSRRWAQNLIRAKLLLRTAPVRRLVLSGVPHLDQFPALPYPLGALLGERARTLDRMMRDSLAPGEILIPFELDFEPQLFAADGFHPSASGFQLWGKALAQALIGSSGAHGSKALSESV